MRIFYALWHGIQHRAALHTLKKQGIPTLLTLTAEWLNQQPTDEFFHRTMRIVCAFLDTLPPAKRAYHRTKVISDCISVAKASGGLLGLSGRISDAEMMMMEQIIEELRPRP